MKTAVKIAKIGNSQGIRLQKHLLDRYKIEDSIEMETTPDAIILRAPSTGQLSWTETYQQMAAEGEDWSEWEAVAEDGLHDEH